MISRSEIKLIKSLKLKKYRIVNKLFLLEGLKCINEVLNEKRKRYGQHDYYGNNVGGRNSISGYPGVWEEEKKEEKEIEIIDDADVEEVEILDDVEDIENVTININEEELINDISISFI